MRKDSKDVLKGIFGDKNFKEDNDGVKVTSGTINGDSELGRKILELLKDEFEGKREIEDCDCLYCKAIKAIEAIALKDFKTEGEHYKELCKRFAQDKDFKKFAREKTKKHLNGQIRRNLKEAIGIYISAYQTNKILNEE